MLDKNLNEVNPVRKDAFKNGRLSNGVNYLLTPGPLLQMPAKTARLFSFMRANLPSFTFSAARHNYPLLKNLQNYLIQRILDNSLGAGFFKFRDNLSHNHFVDYRLNGNPSCVA